MEALTNQIGTEAWLLSLLSRPARPTSNAAQPVFASDFGECHQEEDSTLFPTVPEAHVSVSVYDNCMEVLLSNGLIYGSL